MNKNLVALFAVSAMGLVACGKSGSVSGTVYDPFTGKAVELPTVFIKDTPFTSQKIPGGLKDGTYKFEKVKPGTYTISAGKNKYSKTNIEFSITEDQLNVQQDLFIYNREGLTPGMYKPVANQPAEKIANDWVNSEVVCKESIMALRPKFKQDAPNAKGAKKEQIEVVLADAKAIEATINLLYYNASSMSSMIEAKAYPANQEKASDHSDCAGIDTKKEPYLIVPQKDKGTQLTTTYKSENLYEISGTLPKGKSLLTLHQDGKLLKTYYFEVK